MTNKHYKGSTTLQHFIEFGVKPQNMSAPNRKYPPELRQSLEFSLYRLTKRIDEVRRSAPVNGNLLELAEENLQLAVDALLDGELDEVETLVSMAAIDLQQVTSR